MSEINDKPSNGSPASPAGLLNFAPGSYLDSTSQPRYALLFLLPMIIIYELGTILVNTRQIANTINEKRVMAYVWLERSAESVGIASQWAWAFPGVMVVVILFAWHMWSRHPWKVRLPWLGWMAAESIVLTFPLFILSALINRTGTVPSAALIPLQQSTSAAASDYPANLITSIGAGIYEELVFRLILMGLALLLLEDALKLKSSLATLIAVFFSAALFSAHHYIGYTDLGLQWLEAFRIESFLFRAAAGIYFALIFRYRGYGITAGTHAAYNIILYTLC